MDREQNKIGDNLLIISYIPIEYGGKDNGGIATHTIQLIKNLRDKFKVSVYTPTIRKGKNLEGVKLLNSENNKLLKTIVSIYGLFKILFSHRGRKFISLLSFKEKLLLGFHYSNLSKIFEKNKYTAVHIHSLNNYIAIMATIIYGNQNIVVTDHGFWQNKNIAKDIFKIQAIERYIDTLIYISSHSNSQLRNYGINVENKIKISNPFEFININSTKEELQENLFIPADKTILLFIAPSEPVVRKGLDLLLQAIDFEDSITTNFHLIIVTGEEGIKYADKYKDRLSITCYLPMDYLRVIEFYKAADVFVLPSRSESFGLVYIESLAYGTPIVGYSEVVNEFKDLYGKELYIGESFDPIIDSIEDLANKIKTATNSKVNKNLLASKTQELFSWQNKTDKFIQIYKKKGKQNAL